MKDRRIIILCIIAVITIAALLIGSYFRGTHVVKITYTNIRSGEIIATTESGSSQKIKDLAKSGTSYRLPNNIGLSVVYNSEGDYASGSHAVPTVDGDIVIDPDYSEVKKKTIMDKALPVVTAALHESYPRSSQYTIMSGDLFDHGSWYVVLLQFNGDYDFNTDSLRVLFKKQDQTWQRVTKPQILLTVYNSPGINADVLETANLVPNPVKQPLN